MGVVFIEGTMTGPAGKQATAIHSSGMTAKGFPDGSRTAQRLGVLVLASMMLLLTFPGPAWADKFGKARKKLNEALTWKFGPALRDGTPVPVRVIVEVNFRLY